MSDTPQLRNSVRVLLLDERDRLLLFRKRAAGDAHCVWFPPGVGLEDGEDARAAAVREVAEETGLAEVALRPPPTSWCRPVDVRV